MPIYVDLDVSQSVISLPGTLSAVCVERTSSLSVGAAHHGDDTVSGSTVFNVDAQLAYHFGYKTPGENPVLYRRLITVLKDAINFRSEQIVSSLVSGCVINTTGWIKDEGFKSLLHTAREFDVSTVLVLDQERLSVEFEAAKRRDELPDTVRVVSVPKSGGVVCKSTTMRTNAKNQRIHEYFYGTPRATLYPHSIEIAFAECKIFKLGAPQLPDSLLPMGMRAEDNYTKIFQISPCKKIAIFKQFRYFGKSESF